MTSANKAKTNTTHGSIFLSTQFHTELWSFFNFHMETDMTSINRVSRK